MHGPQNGGWTRKEYLLRVFTYHCVNCHQSHTTSDLVDIYVRESTSGFAEYPRCPKIEGGYPVGVTRLPIKDVPVCHLCIDSYTPVKATHLTEDEWRANIKKTWQDAKPIPHPRVTTPAAHPRRPTTDDL